MIFLDRNQANLREELKVLKIQKISGLLEIIFILLQIDVSSFEDLSLIPSKEQVFSCLYLYFIYILKF